MQISAPAGYGRHREALLSGPWLASHPCAGTPGTRLFTQLCPAPHTARSLDSLMNLAILTSAYESQSPASTHTDTKAKTLLRVPRTKRPPHSSKKTQCKLASRDSNCGSSLGVRPPPDLTPLPDCRFPLVPEIPLNIVKAHSSTYLVLF